MQQGVFIKVISVFDEFYQAVQATLSNCICLKLKISTSKCQTAYKNVPCCCIFTQSTLKTGA